MRSDRRRAALRAAASLTLGVAALGAGLAHAGDASAPLPAAPAAQVAPTTAPATSAASNASAAAAEAAQPIGAAVPAQPYSPSTEGNPHATQDGASGRAQQQIRIGDAIAFRTLIPPALLEQLTASEYVQIVQSAAQGGRLLDAKQPRAKRLRAIVAKLAPYAVKWNDRVKGWTWETNVIRSRDIRVTCLPGGKVLLYEGMLDRVRLNDDELGVLLAHGIAHALRDHARASFANPSQTPLHAAALPPLFGVGDPLPQPVNSGERLQMMRYDPTDETEADVIGGDIAARAGFDPRAAVTLWDKLAAATRANRGTGFIYTHPYSAARRRDLLNRLPDLMPLYAKAVGKRLDALPEYAGISAQRRKFVLR